VLPHHHRAGADPARRPDAIRIHSLADLSGDRTTLVTTRPLRAPHHTLSDAGRIGGGQVPMPGEVSRVHHGVGFLDARPEFRRHVLDTLRQALENGAASIPAPARP
jgi:magnesium chelatase family protein